MIYFYAEDHAYYSKSELAELCATYQLEKIISFPEISNIKEASNNPEAVGFISPHLPSGLDKRFENTNFFEVIHLKNKHGVLTTGQKKAGIKEEDALREKLGINIHRSSLTLADYGGAELLIREARKLVTKERYGYPIKGYMLAGIPGTGKSFFAKCIAGETDRLLVELNLSRFMEQQNTIYLIEMVFSYFVKNPGRYILWMDEIEKMLVGDMSQQVLGVLLTKINDLNAEGNSSLFVLATANNISEIAKRNPEFLRNGRFDLLLFMLPPIEENAVIIFELYIRKAKKAFISNVVPKLLHNALGGLYESDKTIAYLLQLKLKAFYKDVSMADAEPADEEAIVEFCKKHPEMIMEIAGEYQVEFDPAAFVYQAQSHYRKSIDADRFVYTPAEIQFVVDDVYFSYYLEEATEADEVREDVDSDDRGLEYAPNLYDRMIAKYKPLQVTLESSLSAMKGAASGFEHI